MCTVTYIPIGKNDFILTSNRDESPLRKTISPKTYIEEGVKLIYPKDEVSGGTWVGLSDKKRLVCLLNGGFKKHQRAANYKMSRGVVVKQLLKVDDAVSFVEKNDFKNIEPFTIILIDWQDKLIAYELVWTGDEKYFKILKNEPKIWSSSTLYDKSMKVLREQWFKEWLDKTEVITQEKIMAFHQDETKGNSEMSLKMKRDIVETISTTLIRKNNFNTTIDYHTYLK